MISSKQSIKITLIFIGFCCGYAIAIYKLYFMQIVQHEFYKGLAKKQSQITLTQNPARALIFDRNGIVIAANKETTSAFITPKKLHQKKALLFFLEQYFPKAYIQLLHEKQNAPFLFIARRLTDAQKQLISNAHLIKDIKLLYEPGRFYPHPACIPIIGLTNIDNKGISGIEYNFDEILAGTPATFVIQKDARDNSLYVQKDEIEPGTSGEPIYVTIDSTLQFLVSQILESAIHEWESPEAAAVVMNPENGDILAMVSISPNQNGDLLIDSKNYPTNNMYEFGSVNKIFTALAALEEGIVTLDTMIDCKGKTTAYIEGRVVNTWKAHGLLPFWEVIAKSNNIGIALVAKELDTKLYDHYRRLGFGKKQKIPLPGVATGFINHPSNWSKQSIISLSYGYEVASTLLQLASAFCLIAHNGCLINPRLILSDPIIIKKKKYSDQAIEGIQKILERTTEQGTAQRARIKGYRVMLKTGSAHMLIDGMYSETKNIYSCAGIIEKNNYKRVIALYIQKEGRGQKELFASQVAVPIAEKIAQKILLHDHIIA
jgi:cell division protein FtsI/penicillin-binding protein 2